MSGFTGHLHARNKERDPEIIRERPHKNTERPKNNPPFLFAQVCNNYTMATANSSNTSPMVHEEPEDIFAIRTEQKDEMMSTDPSKIVTPERTKKDGSEMTTTLVDSSASSPLDETESIQNEEEEKEFEIPQKLTKSGRKRAVPFTLKVRTS
jgi:hypothetical protein